MNENEKLTCPGCLEKINPSKMRVMVPQQEMRRDRSLAVSNMKNKIIPPIKTAYVPSCTALQKE